MYEERIYRNWVRNGGLVGFQAVVRETDLFIKAERDLSVEAIDSIIEFRSQIEEYVKINPEFQTTLKPYKVNGKAPLIIKEMSKASSLVGVGPFAAVAGAIAEYAGRRLLKYSRDVIIENGGDIFIQNSKDILVGIYAGSSTFSGRVAIRINAADTPLGVCTSSGTVGHSLSFGKADAAVAISKSASLADAAATSIGNVVLDKTDVPKAINFAKKIKGLRGVVVIKDDKIGVWGDIEICRI